MTAPTLATAPGELGDLRVREALATALWISPEEGAVAPPGQRPAYLVRCRFDAAGGAPAWLYATAHGIYEVFLNGVRVGDQELTPGFSAYRRRLEVQRHELTDLVESGVNTLVVVLSDGWFRGRHGFERRADGFGTRTGLLAAVVGEDGEPLTATDATWRSRPSHITRADLMDGQAVDLRALDPGWFTGTDDGGWRPVVVSADAGAVDPGRLVAPSAPPVRRVEEVPVDGLSRPRPGTVVVDFGQNVNGWVRLVDLGPAGTHLTLTHGEALDPAGLVTTHHLRAFDFASHELLPAGQVDEVVSAGRPGEVFEPRHTTHGFRYVQVDGVPEGLDLSGATAVVVQSDLARTGEFTCSDERLNRLHEVVRWSLRDNTCALPTDCPQRERSGFTGDWQVFVATAALMADVDAFSRRWLRDLAADQWADGRIPTIVPNPGGDRPSGVAFEDASAGSAGWGDAAAIVPWELWRAYGDLGGLAGQFPAMRRWVDYAAGCAASRRHPDRAAARPVPAAHERYLWDTGFHFGEWLEPDVPPAPDASVDHGIVATAYLHRSAAITAATARVLGEEAVAAGYQQIAEGARDAWQAEYLLPDGTLAEERQAHYVRALAFDLVPEGLRQPVADRLAALVHANDDRLNTGFLATGMLLPALADHGHADLAGRLLTRTGQPSWLGMLEAGATTMWERWDGVAPDGTATGSLNHYSKGAVASFLHTHLVGLRLPEFPTAAEAGYRRIRIAPTPLPGITSASSTQQTASGPLTVAWRIDGPTFVLDVDLPVGTIADVDLPDGRTCRLRQRAQLTCPAPRS
ncbi:MAG: family 78 glycoside hydrolase catalytic domain [Propionicimonas sp.]|uniref:family 78 glycoside hydrolase catalytic domain n=1 Tax=Propionicimonas sp. TaxID=1955623 RepID=UPI003D0D1956